MAGIQGIAERELGLGKKRMERTKTHAEGSGLCATRIGVDHRFVWIDRWRQGATPQVGCSASITRRVYDRLWCRPDQKSACAKVAGHRFNYQYASLRRTGKESSSGTGER